MLFHLSAKFRNFAGLSFIIMRSGFQRSGSCCSNMPWADQYIEPIWTCSGPRQYSKAENWPSVSARLFGLLCLCFIFFSSLSLVILVRSSGIWMWPVWSLTFRTCSSNILPNSSPESFNTVLVVPSRRHQSDSDTVFFRHWDINYQDESLNELNCSHDSLWNIRLNTTDWTFIPIKQSLDMECSCMVNSIFLQISPTKPHKITLII